MKFAPAVQELADKIRALHNFDYAEGSVRDLDIQRVIADVIAPLLEQCDCVVLNARIVPDPQMLGSTETCAVPIDDVEGLQDEALRWQANGKKVEIARWEKPE